MRRACARCCAASDQNPLGSAAGYGTPGLPLDREATARALGFAAMQEPVTAVQLSRGKAEAQLLFEITLLMQDLGRLAADVLLFYTQEFGVRRRCREAFTTGSSIMPQKRNPDVFELIRGRTATAQACLLEALGDLRQAALRLSPRPAAAEVPLFRGIDLALQTLEILPAAVAALQLPPGAHPPRSSPSMRPRRPTAWSWPKAFRSARPTGASRRGSSASSLFRPAAGCNAQRPPCRLAAQKRTLA